MEVEAIARVNGAVPASIDIMYGVPPNGKFFIFLDGTHHIVYCRSEVYYLLICFTRK
jgi:hypothetical protein